MKKLLILSVCIITLIAMAIKCCSNPSTIEFNELRFNSPQQIIEELGLTNLPAFHYVGNRAHAFFMNDYWDCTVEFQFNDSLSLQDKEEIIKQIANKDEFHWIYENLPNESVAEFHNIKYGDKDTIRYTIAITNKNVYIAYDDCILTPTEELFLPEDYQLIRVINGHWGPDSSHEWTIQLKKPYTQYLDRLKESDGWECEKTHSYIRYTKKNYSQGRLSSDESITFYKKRNIAVIDYGSY